MAHFTTSPLHRPPHFNFASDVVDYWSTREPPLQAMHWVSADGSEQRELTYRHFSLQSRRIARLLQDLGARKGDIVIMILPRIPEWWELATAALRSGLVICPCTTLLVDKDIEYRVQVSGARFFVGDETSVGKVLKVKAQCPSLERVIQIDGAQRDDVIDFRVALRQVPSDGGFQKVDLKPTDPSLIFFTSGTTGPPKMVLHNQISYPLAHTLTGKHWLLLEPGKLYWNLSEQGWAKAAWSFFGAWNCGASLFIMDDRGAFNPRKLLDVIHSYPITTLCAPPTAYRQLVLDESQQYFKSNPPWCLQHCVGAGEPLNESVIKTWQKMSGMEIFDGYGQTETILMCANQIRNPIRPGSMGKPLPTIPLAVIDADGHEVKPGTEGDIAVLLEDLEGRKHDSFFGIFDGYIDMKTGKLDRRLRSFEGQPGKSWYLTGDRATRDEDGYFWFVGRSDDVINSSGYRIGPFEVESTLKTHPAVVESAVVASPDRQREEVVKAFIVLTEKASKSDPETLKKEIQDYCKENAAPYKYPRKIDFVDASFLPKTISGKIKRAELKKMERDKFNRENKL